MQRHLQFEVVHMHMRNAYLSCLVCYAIVQNIQVYLEGALN